MLQSTFILKNSLWTELALFSSLKSDIDKTTVSRNIWFYTVGWMHPMCVFLLTVSETSMPDQHHNYSGILREAFCYQRSLFSPRETSSPSRHVTCQHERALYPSRKEVSGRRGIGTSWFSLCVLEKWLPFRTGNTVSISVTMNSFNTSFHIQFNTDILSLFWSVQWLLRYVVWMQLPDQCAPWCDLQR